MKIREKYQPIQVEKYYEKFKVGKISLIDLMKVVDNSVNEMTFFSHYKAIFTNFLSQFKDEEFYYFYYHGFRNYYKYLNAQRNVRRIEYHRNHVRERIGEYFFQNNNISCENKLKLWVYLFLKQTTVYREDLWKCYNVENNLNFIEVKTLFNMVHQVICEETYEQWEYNSVVKSYIDIYRIFNEYRNAMEIKKMAYDMFCEKQPQIMQHIQSANMINVFFSEFTSQNGNSKGVVKSIIKENLNKNIIALLEKDFPFGECINAIVEVMTQETLSMDEESIEKLNSMAIAFKLLK